MLLLLPPPCGAAFWYCLLVLQVKPRGPMGKPEPEKSVPQIRGTFGRMVSKLQPGCMLWQLLSCTGRTQDTGAYKPCIPFRQRPQ